MENIRLFSRKNSKSLKIIENNNIESMNMKRMLSMCFVGICAVYSVYAQRTFLYEGNPIVTDKFTADPAPMVHDGKLYLYVGHDEYYAGQDTASGFFRPWKSGCYEAFP